METEYTNVEYLMSLNPVVLKRDHAKLKEMLKNEKDPMFQKHYKDRIRAIEKAWTTRATRKNQTKPTKQNSSKPINTNSKFMFGYLQGTEKGKYKEKVKVGQIVYFDSYFWEENEQGTIIEIKRNSYGQYYFKVRSHKTRKIHNVDGSSIRTTMVKFLG